MRSEFRNTLEMYNAIAKDKAKADLSSQEVGDLDKELEEEMRQEVEFRHTTKGAEKKIFALQQKKSEIMNRLKGDIAKLDDPEYKPERVEGDRRIVEDDGKYFWRGVKEGKPNIQVLLGEIMMDGEWGIKYYLDPNTVDRNIRKRYLIECAKGEMKKLLDRQIIKDEVASESTHYLKRNAYKAMDERNPENLSGGIIAEKMVRNFLKKMEYDYDASFDILSVDAYEDVENKIDFVVHRKKHLRGVKVEEDESENVGVQFYMDQTKEEFKQKQIARVKERIHQGDEIGVEDIVLVTVPMEYARDTYAKWSDGGKLPGGPDKLWDIKTKDVVFRGVMNGILLPEEIETEWNKIAAIL
jgi:hypothetical protein